MFYVGAGTSVHVTISTFQHNTCGSYLQDVVTDMLQNVTDEMRNGLPIQRFCGVCFTFELQYSIAKVSILNILTLIYFFHC